MKIRYVRLIAPAIALAAVAAGFAGVPSPAGAQAAPCGPPPAPQSFGEVTQNIDTTLGCNNGTGVSSNPATGYIAIKMLQGSTQMNFGDHLRATDGTSSANIHGTYTVSFSNCTGGTAAGATYTYSGGALPRSLSYTASSPEGMVACRFSILVEGTRPETLPFMQNIVLTPTGNAYVGPSVGRFSGPAPAVPEAPFAVLFVILGVAAAGVFIVRRQRSRQDGEPVSSPSSP